mmetsp:Transcript_33660/g.107245  ORF Transcript_33660/g.107245 Transcript_33660/m.107245 type:complete len:212 (-) Transcript_33660:920-1555(-)
MREEVLHARHVAAARHRVLGRASRVLLRSVGRFGCTLSRLAIAALCPARRVERPLHHLVVHARVPRARRHTRLVVLAAVAPPLIAPTSNVLGIPAAAVVAKACRRRPAPNLHLHLHRLQLLWPVVLPGALAAAAAARAGVPLTPGGRIPARTPSATPPGRRRPVAAFLAPPALRLVVVLARLVGSLKVSPLHVAVKLQHETLQPGCSGDRR